MDVVTVTCQRDISQMILQSESIQRFLAPCTHWVILCDPDANEDHWKSILSPYYTRHTLKIWKPDVFLDRNGWDKQQAYKLLVSKFLDDDYLVLDSKNFFVKQCQTEDWRNILGPGFTHRPTNTLAEVSQAYSDYFKKPMLSRILSIETPFVFKIEVLRKFNIDTIVEHLLSKLDPSEFLAYSYMLDSAPTNTKCRHITFWPQDGNKVENIDAICSPNYVKVVGLHRRLLLDLSELEMDKINDWLRCIGLSNRLTFKK